jgi:hypothetical protein
MAFKLLERVVLGTLSKRQQRTWDAKVRRRQKLAQQLAAQDALMSAFARDVTKDYPAVQMTDGHWHQPGLLINGQIVVHICPCPDCQAHFQGKTLEDTTHQMIAGNLIPPIYIPRALKRVAEAVKKGVATLQRSFIN